MTTKWQKSMTLDRFEMFKAAKTAFEQYQPQGFDVTLGELMADDTRLTAYFGAQMTERVVTKLPNGRTTDVTLVGKDLRHVREDIARAVAELATPLINNAVGFVGGRKETADASLDDKQYALDRLFGFKNQDGESYGISKTTLEITKAMQAAIKASVAQQRASHAAIGAAL